MKKKLIVITIIFAILCVAFFGTVSKLKKEQTIDPEQEQDGGLRRYMTEEVITVQEALEMLGVEKVPYIAFQCDYDNEKQEYNEIYYIYDEKQIQKIMDTLLASKLYVAEKVDAGNYTTGSGFNVWLGIEENVNVKFWETETKWEMNHCTFFLSTQADYMGVEGNSKFEKFESKYFYGFFIQDNVEEVLWEIMKEEVAEITLCEARTIVADGTAINRASFQQYLHTAQKSRDFLDGTLGTACMKYELADEEGYLCVYDSLATGRNREVLLVEWYNKEGQLVEVLYEAEVLKGN